MPEIFISYNHGDQAAARWFAKRFADEGFDVWWDETISVGQAYDQVTEDALRAAKAVVVLWSKTSVASRWVRAEATLADRNRTLVPVMIEPCDRPIIFELTQTADLSEWRTGVDSRVWEGLLADIRAHVARSPAPAPIAAPPPPTAEKKKRGKTGGVPSLAVLPFTNRSGLPEDEVFAFGMVEDIIDAMSQGVEVRVIGSSATAKFRRGAMPDIEAMARELGVRYVLEGNVRRSGENLRVTTQLMDADSGSVAWTQKFDRPLAQLATLQEDLVLEVAAQLRTQSHRLEIERALRKVDDLTAWEAVMRSIAAMRNMTGASLMAAIAEARTAVEIAPDYGLALALVAQAEAVLYNQVWPDTPAEVARIRAEAERAIALSPDNTSVMSTASGALSLIGCPEDGLVAGLRAIALNPNNEFGMFACGLASTLLDHTDDAVRYFEKEAQLAPNHPTMWISLGWRGCAFSRAGRWAEAAETYARAITLTPDNSAPHIGIAVCRRQLGLTAEAARSMATARKLEPETPLSLWELRFGRSHETGAVKTGFLDHLRILWAEAEPAT